MKKSWITSSVPMIEFDLAPDGNVKFVNLTLARRMLNLPHPLFSDNVDLHRIVRWPRLLEKELSAPGEHGHRNDERDN